MTPSPIVAREKGTPTNAEFRLELQQGGQKADQAFIRLTDDEKVTTGFDFNYDLSKEFNKNKANVYTMITSMIDDDLSVTEAAGNTLPMSEQTTIVPVGVKITTNGDYTFAMPDGTYGIGVTLVDNETSLRTPLGMTDYTVSLEAGTYNERFVLEISPVQKTPTGLEETVTNNQSSAKKVMVDGVLYIVKDGQVFDARGAKVK